MADIPQSRTEEILYATINGEEYTGLPESRIEELLLELKEVIEAGGGGGGGTSTIAWKPTVAADGTISWVRTASETKPEDQNIKGPKGDDGDTGLGIKLVSINQQGHLIITFDDDTTQDAGAIPGGGGAVDSVNGKTGTVLLDAEDVGALPDDTTIPSKTSDLTNDSGFITKAVNDLVNYYLTSETYTKSEVNALIGAIRTIHFEAVLTLPTEDIQTNVIYLVPKSISQSDNIKDEYINLDGTSAGWEKIGETEIDLSNYVTITALNTALADYVTSASLATILASYAQTSQLPGVATASTAGLVKPDGETTFVDANGVLSVIEQLPAPPVINLEGIESENDVNTKSATFTAASTATYLLIEIIAGDTFPVITSFSATVNGDDVNLNEYYSDSAHINSKYAILNLEAGDVVAASVGSSIGSYGTSASIMLIKLSSSIQNLVLKDSDARTSGECSVDFNIDKDGFYLLFFLDRREGSGIDFNTIKLNDETITKNRIICQVSDGWEVRQGMCIASAKALDNFKVSSQARGYADAVGIFYVETGSDVISYSDLTDKPQINGVELNGNKTAAQLGLATSASVSAITDGQSIDSFSDVETALNGKMNNTYLEETVTLSTSSTTTVTFTDSSILATSVIDIAVSVWGLTPEDVTVSSGICTVVMPKVSSAQTITVRIYVR